MTRQNRRRMLGACGARLGVAWGGPTRLQRLCNADSSAGEWLGIATLLNRKGDAEFELPADRWYQIAPIGEFPHAASGLVQVIDTASVQAMANALKPGEELLIDFDHESHDSAKRTTAAGWIQNLQARADGLYAQIRLTKSGAEAIKGGDYRFISPVWMANDCEQLDKKRIRPLRLNDAGITNTPNLRGLSPLSNREESRPQHAAEQADLQKEQMKLVATELGLSADASEASVVAAIQGLKNSEKSAKDALAPLQTELGTLKNSYTSLLNSQVKSDLDTAGLEGEDRKPWEVQLLANREGTLPLLAQFVKNRGNKAASALTNRSTASTPGDRKDAPAGDAADRAKQIEDAVANAKGETYEQRFENAKRTKPELFATPQE